MLATVISRTTSVELATDVIGNWKQTYQWIPIFGGIIAFLLAFAAGANNLPISFSSLMGSGALTFFKAATVAAVLYIPGGVVADDTYVNSLLLDFIKENQPSEGFLMWSLVVVLITATIWIALATYFELPVSPQHSIEAALLGTMFVTKGFTPSPFFDKNGHHNYHGGGFLWIFLEWTVAPMVSCACAFCFFWALRSFILHHKNGEKRIYIFLPVYCGIAAGLLSFFFMHQVIPISMRLYKRTIMIAIAMATLIGSLLSLLVVVPLAKTRIESLPTPHNREQNSSMQQCTKRQGETCHTKDEDKYNAEDAMREFMQMRVLHTVYEEDEQSLPSPQIAADIEHIPSLSQTAMGQSAAFKQLLESSPHLFVQTRNSHTTEKAEDASKFFRYFRKSSCFPFINCDRKTMIRHALAEKFDENEPLLRFPHILTSCIFALIQSVCETPGLMSPFQAIFEIFLLKKDHPGKWEDHVGSSLHVDRWLKAAGGLSASIGFLLCGWRLMQSLGSRLTYISNSRGLTFQLSAVATMILMNATSLPKSSVHTSIGALVGVGIADNSRNVNWKLLLKFLYGWMMTLIFCCLVAYGIYSFSIHSPALRNLNNMKNAFRIGSLADKHDPRAIFTYIIDALNKSTYYMIGQLGLVQSLFFTFVPQTVLH